MTSIDGSLVNITRKLFVEKDKMTFPTDWDVEKYYDETEPELHWELRKEFMEQNKTTFAEDYLVALARTFSNMEFMGCV